MTELSECPRQGIVDIFNLRGAEISIQVIRSMVNFLTGNLAGTMIGASLLRAPILLFITLTRVRLVLVQVLERRLHRSETPSAFRVG